MAARRVLSGALFVGLISPYHIANGLYDTQPLTNIQRDPAARGFRRPTH